MTYSGEHHGQIVGISDGNYFRVAPGTTWLDNRANTCCGRCLNAVTKRKKSVRGNHSALHRQLSGIGFGNAQLSATDTAGLPGANTDSLLILSINNGVGFNPLGYLPGE